jgi:hypothetical protein
MKAASDRGPNPSRTNGNHGKRQQPRSCPANPARREKTGDVQQQTHISQDLQLLPDSCPVPYSGLSRPWRPAPCNSVIYGACPVLPCNLRGCRDGVFPVRGRNGERVRLARGGRRPAERSEWEMFATGRCQRRPGRSRSPFVLHEIEVWRLVMVDGVHLVFVFTSAP